MRPIIVDHATRPDNSPTIVIIAFAALCIGIMIGVSIGDKINDRAHRANAEQQIRAALDQRGMHEYQASLDHEAPAHAAKARQHNVRRVAP